MTTPARRPRDRAARRPPRVGRPHDQGDVDHRHARPRRRRDDRDRHRDRVLRPPRWVAGPPRPVRPRGDRRRRPPGRRAPHRRGRRARARRGIRRGARRSCRDRPVRAELRADGRVARHHRRRPRRAAVCGHRPAVPRRTRRRLPLQLVEHALEAFARTAGARSTSAAPGATTTTWPRPRSSRSAARSASPASSTHGATGVASTKGVARMSMTRATPRIAVVDYGAGNMVSIEQALTAVGADVRSPRGPRTSRAPMPSSYRASARPSRRWRASHAQASSTRSGRGSPPTGRSSGSASASSCCSRAATRMAR